MVWQLRQNTSFPPLHSLTVAALFLCLFSSGLRAQQTTRYVYDDNGRLRAVLAPSGEANVYEYDAAGNFTAIRRNDATTLEVLDFAPREGAPGTQVKIVGSGFGSGVTAVSFNGTAAQIVATNGQQVIVRVPNGATTGTISVTAGSKTATSARSFVVRGISVTPSTADVLSQQNVQFAATAVTMEDQNVVWSVEGLEGGSAAVGTVSATGLYVSPKLLANQPSTVFRVRATSVIDPGVVGEAQVTVRNPEFFAGIYSSFVAVLNGTSNNQIAANLFSQGVSIRNGTINNQIAANLFSQVLSVSKGPGVTGVSPVQISRGTTRTVTITGMNLTGTTEIVFLNSDGTASTGLMAASLAINPAGTSLTANVSVSAGAALGQRVVVVKTPGDRSPPGRTSLNTIEVIP